MPKPPRLVHLLFHSDFPSARELARHVHRQLNEDAVAPGLRVPMAFCPYRGASAPPEVDHLTLAERSFVAILAGERLNVDEPWCTFLTKAQNEEVFDSIDPTRIAELILTWLGKLR